MKRQFFSIGKISIVLNHDPALDIVLDPALYNFTSEPVDSPDMVFDLNVTSPFPDITACKKIFTTAPGGLWTILGSPDKNGYIISLQNMERDERPYKTVQTDKRFSRFLIHHRPNTSGRVAPLEYPLDELAVSGHLNLNGIGIILHSACISFNGQGYLFSGVSGSGKSTLSEIWRKDGETDVLTDERVIIREVDGKLRAYGTPWHGTAQIHRNADAPADKIFFIKHGKCNRARPISTTDAANRLMVRCFPTFWNREGMDFTVDFCIRIAGGIDCYELEFIPDESVIEYVKGLG
ncbi:hypothetical protein BMS3Bbin06_01729 [bacterium BMS3Bbin06]|nr:hypothetical protein BMS3Bbin06_01729 [bacterium BMS3Bbin06]